MTRHRGLTLLESMITTLIILMVLGVVAGLASRYRQAAVFSAQKDQEIQGAQSTLGMLRKELLSAFQMVSPAPGTSTPSSTLQLLRVDPNAGRLPADPSTAPPTWDPFDPTTTAQVTYDLVGERLTREVQTAGMTTATAAGQGIVAFSVRFLANRNIQVDLSVKSQTKQISLRTQVFRGHRDEP